MKLFSRVAFILVCSSFGLGACQKKSKIAIPAFNLLLLDSTTILGKELVPEKRPVVFIYFKPDCPMCRVETKSILDSMKSLKDINFYFLLYSSSSFEKARQFSKEFNLENYENVTVGLDKDHLIYKQFKPTGVPFTIVFNKYERLVAVFHGETTVSEIRKMASQDI